MPRRPFLLAVALTALIGEKGVAAPAGAPIVVPGSCNPTSYLATNPGTPQAVKQVLPCQSMVMIGNSKAGEFGFTFLSEGGLSVGFLGKVQEDGIIHVSNVYIKGTKIPSKTALCHIEYKNDESYEFSVFHCYASMSDGPGKRSVVSVDYKRDFSVPVQAAR